MWLSLPPLVSDRGGRHGALTSSYEARANDGAAAASLAPVIRQEAHFGSSFFDP
jgi:hypothetical protein